MKIKKKLNNGLISFDIDSFANDYKLFYQNLDFFDILIEIVKTSEIVTRKELNDGLVAKKQLKKYIVVDNKIDNIIYTKMALLSKMFNVASLNLLENKFQFDFLEVEIENTIYTIKHYEFINISLSEISFSPILRTKILKYQNKFDKILINY
jgi:hypothetical protein